MAVESSQRVLHCAAEYFPFVKTGGLADVVAALPQAQRQRGCDSRVVLPGSPGVLQALASPSLLVDVGNVFGCGRLKVVQGYLGPHSQPVYALDAPLFFDRLGGPYQDEHGQDWPDNAQRFALLGWVAAQLAAGRLDPLWQPNVLHAHDWHSALSLAYLAAHGVGGVARIFTIHNLAYQGLFPLSDHALIGLSSRWLTPQALEFHGQLSFMKAGLTFADRITTVSPTYAREIIHAERGEGLQGLLRQRESDLIGILNGMDTEVWNPATDPWITQRFDAQDLSGKSACKRAVFQAAQLDDATGPLMVCIGRLSTQKGVDLLLQCLPELVDMGFRVVIQGSGDPTLESAVRAEAQLLSGRVQAYIGYDEARAHQLMSAADVVAVPSRFEPCGLTQLYGMRYGALPLVRRTGGLADTVGDILDARANAALGPGFVFDALTPQSFLHAATRAADLFQTDSHSWQQLIRRAMQVDHGWSGPAQQYVRLYEEVSSEHARAR